ncbi:MAG: methylmalonyl Co-A mutase-associated GTPase MeaB [Deltaproteobacteria bacterium]|nr:MAG: methylmalonyl Co-A mutase-associated GTPase MeaB [Deltaproteobacteria bacterium]
MSAEIPRRPPLDVEALAADVLRGDRAALGRAITLVESNRDAHWPAAQALVAALLPHTGKAVRVGISGVPGVGKSTFIEAFGSRLTAQGHRVAVLAIDPSSSVSGGSILGDKTRMARLARDPAAFVRPSPSSGSLGGVTRKTRESILVCEAAAFDVILVETVGVGQNETVVADMVDTFLVLMLTGAGDELQGIKRGIVEMADILAVNKADGANAQRAEAAARSTERALRLLPPRPGAWRPPVLTCSAIEGHGLDRLWDEVVRHRERLEEKGELDRLRARQRGHWMWSLIDHALHHRLRTSPRAAAVLDEVEQSVLDGGTPPSDAARRVVDALFGQE